MRDDPWLAERLGRPAFTVEADDGPGVAPASPAFLQTRVPSADTQRVAALERAGWSVIDVTVTLAREPGPLDGGVAWTVAPARGSETEALLAIAERDYTVSRFHLDPLIPDSIAGRVKRDWLAACLDGKRGEGVLAALDASGSPAGFLAVLETENASVIDLVAVSAAARGAGAGRALVAHLVTSADHTVQVGTQIANVGALRFYEELGFRTRETRYVLHCHR